MIFTNPPELVINNEFNVTLAIQCQRKWAGYVEQQDKITTPALIAGVDIAYDYPSNRAFSAAVVLDAKTLQPVEIKTAISTIEIPYRSGFLSFREVPAISKALEQLEHKPDLIVCDGQGIAHPRRFGIACHLGLLHNIPTIGCGKSRLYGFAEEPPNQRGAFSWLYDNKKSVIGMVLRTRVNVKPVYLSIGHGVSLPTAQHIILQLSPRFRLPETTRLADRLAGEFKKEILAEINI
ncbi:deoxyribonuclease V [Legionella dresdenensis]|uniref:Endonuclease V n=1 Tax=Legionella dresdenensis TaxID=450200 RepID=A0ABV8CEI8_9GAMM